MRDSIARADSLARIDSLRRAAADSLRQRKPDPMVHVLPLIVDTLRLRRPVLLGQLGPAHRPAADATAVARRIAEDLRHRVEERRVQRWQTLLTTSLTANHDTTTAVAARPTPLPGALVPITPDTGAAEARAQFLRDIANYGMNVTAHLESKVQRSRNERCTASQLTIVGNNCFGSFQPAFDFQFTAHTGGVVAQRVHVNVDYESTREFDASNNISVYYQGKSDEVLQRLEVGNVSASFPTSRFLTSGIPAGNYGLQATGQIGPMRWMSIVANQKGNVSKDNVFTVGTRSVQEVNRTIEDIELETRRFFFTVDPRQFAGYPNIDILNRQQMLQLAAALPDSIRPARIYVYRQLIGASNQNPRGPQLSVRGARNPTRQIYELLRENVDYYLDPSMLWISLVRPLNQNNERLAVAYEVNVNGVIGRNPRTGGTPDLEFTEAPQFANLLWEPELQPNNPEYFLREIKSIYRLGGEDVQRGTVSLKIVTGLSGDQEKPVDPSRGETYLQLFGLSQATNPNQFDVENRVWPRPNDPNVLATSGVVPQKLIKNYFVVFPSVQPFARAGLARPIANPANDTLYSYPNEYLYSAQRPQAIYRMVAKYFAEGGASDGAVSLGAVQIRPNSENVQLEGRQLQRNVDYTIDYDVGRITFNRPDTLFPNPRQVTVRYEENPLFAVAPTSILGFASQLPLENGSLSFTAISQHQTSGFNRPPLGFEPNGSLVAGVTGNMNWELAPLAGLIKRLPFGEPSARSRLAMQGEFAMSKPQPNSAGQAYVESFESEAGVPITLGEGGWYYSSQPVLGTYLPTHFGANAFSLPRVSTMAYQNTGVDVAGNLVQFSLPQIDPAVRTVGNGIQTPEQLLWMTLYPLRTGGTFDFDPETGGRRFAWTVGEQTSLGQTPTGRRWRSLRTVLSASGADLSRIENLEFFVLVQSESNKLKRNPTLIFDFGEISENTVAFAPETIYINTSTRPGSPPDTTYRGKRLVGFDRLDSERDPFSRAFNAATNDVGLPGDRADTIVVVDNTKPGSTPVVVNNVRLCTASRSIIQVLSDNRADCTAGNNKLDEEDIDLDGQLNFRSTAADQEQIRRFAVDLSDPHNWTRVGKCYNSTDSSSTGVTSDSLCWVQVRLNWRAPVEEINNPNIRRMRALRMTMLANAQATEADFTRIALAQFKLVGAPWLKRSERPITGVGGDSSSSAAGYVIASVIGTLDSSSTLPYEPPPGVAEVPENRQTGYENTRTQVNERAMRLQAGVPGQQMQVFERAETYFRFPEGTKTFMGYNTLRVWMRGRGHGWGPQGELNGYIKLGRDQNNFYMYRTPVNSGVTQNAWEPEVRVDLRRFQILRAQLENAFLGNSPDSLQCSGVDLELVRRSGVPVGQTVRRFAVCQDGYIVYTTDPAVTPPNLAGVQEMSVGFVRIDSVPRSADALMPNDTLELWINDVRLTDVVDDPGFAGELSMSMNAADLADFRLGISRRDPNFRQLNETPSFLTTSGLTFGTTLHLERMLPARLGIVLPLSIEHNGTGVEQLFLNHSDVRASGITGLRNPFDRRTNYTIALRRAVPVEGGWYAPLINGLALNGSWGSGSSQSTFQEFSGNTYVATAALIVGGESRDDHLPGFIGRIFNALPGGLGKTGFFENIRNARYRWKPTQFRISSSMARAANTTTSFLKAAESPNDTGQMLHGLSHVWSNNANLEIRPIASLTGRVEARQLLDLRDYSNVSSTFGDSTDRAVAANAERLRLFGTDVGLERERSLVSSLSLQPEVSTWFRPRFDLSSSFSLVRDPNARNLLRQGDTTGAFRLPTRLGGAQSITTSAILDPARLITLNTGDASRWRMVSRFLLPFDIQWVRSLTSNYDNTAYIPGFGYQFGFGGIEDYRGVGSRLASNAARLRRLSASSGINLPLNFRFTTRFDDGRSETWTRRSLDGFQALITNTQHTFPDMRLAWSYRPAKLRWLLTDVSLNANYAVSGQGTTALNETGGLADQSRSRSETSTPTATITWSVLGGLTTVATLRHEKREETRPGSITENSTDGWTAEVRRTWRLPQKWKGGRLITRFSYQQEGALGQVGSLSIASTPVNGTPTAPFAPSILTDNGRRAYNLTADTDLNQQTTLTFTGSHVLNFDNNYNRRVSNTNFSVMLTVRFAQGELR